MWQNWFSGFLGLAVIVVTWLNISLALEHWFLIAIGLTVAGLNFWMVSDPLRSREHIIEDSKESPDNKLSI